jgi:pyruvate dehydrogenase E2 component (dihydrolipoamide acetyltransferase)
VAQELGVDLAGLAGSGPGGRIVRRDVEAGAEAPALPGPPAPPPAEVEDGAELVGAKGAARIEQLSRQQQLIARRMAESKATVPEFTLFADVDMSACVELRSKLKELTEAPPSYNDIIVKAAALALRDHPRANGSYRDGAFELHERINVGVAVSAADGLVVPTVFEADRRSLGEIAAETRRLAAAVRDGSVTAPELAGGTFTVSNLGMFGVRAFAAIVNPPQAAILSVGAMEQRAVVAVDGGLVARPTLTLGLICDHRILYGADAAEFLKRIGELLRRPLAMAL